MLKPKFSMPIAVLALGLAAPGIVHARNCELPHEQIQMKCGGDMPNTWDAEADVSANRASGIQKKRPVSEIVREYREKSAAYTALVEKANDDYRTYVYSKNRQ